MKKAVAFWWRFRLKWLFLGFVAGALLAVRAMYVYTTVSSTIVTSPCTAYNWNDDDKRPGDKDYGIAFTGVKATPGVIAIDPEYWSKKLGLPWDEQWSRRPLSKENQAKMALAPVFWNVIFIDADNHQCYYPRDIGKAVKNNLLDISFGDSTPENIKKAKMFGRQWRRFIVIVNNLPSPFFQRTRHLDNGK